MMPLIEAALADGSLRPDADPEAVLFLFRTLYLGTLLHRGSDLPGPDPEAWEALLTQIADGAGPMIRLPAPRRSGRCAPTLGDRHGDRRAAVAAVTHDDVTRHRLSHHDCRLFVPTSRAPDCGLGLEMSGNQTGRTRRPYSRTWPSPPSDCEPRR